MIKAVTIFGVAAAWSVALSAQVPAPAAPPLLLVTPPVAVPVRIAAAASPVVEPVICHSSIETGSLVRRKKVCLTRKQWSYVNDTNHDQAQQLIDDSRSKSGSN